MNKWKVSFFTVFLALVVSNLFWLFFVIDTGITYTYQQDSLEGLDEAHKFLGGLMVKSGKNYTQKDILHLIRLSEPEAFIIEEGNKIIVNGVTFSFENKRLNHVY